MSYNLQRIASLKIKKNIIKNLRVICDTATRLNTYAYLHKLCVFNFNKRIGCKMLFTDDNFLKSASNFLTYLIEFGR